MVQLPEDMKLRITELQRETMYGRAIKSMWDKAAAAQPDQDTAGRYQKMGMYLTRCFEELYFKAYMDGVRGK